MGLPADEWTAAFLGVEQPVVGVVAVGADGLVRIDVGGARVFVTGEARPGERSSLAVRPEDVMLFERDAELPLTTARNRIQATVVSVSPRGATNHVVLDAGGVRLASSVSRASTARARPRCRALACSPSSRRSAVRWRAVGQSEDGPVTARSPEVPCATMPRRAASR